MSQPHFGIDNLVDSEELMSWLLLNPDVDFENLTNILPASAEYAPIPVTNHLDPNFFLAGQDSAYDSNMNSYSIDQTQSEFDTTIPHNTSSFSLNSYDQSANLGSADSRGNVKKSSRKITSSAASTSGGASSSKKRTRESIEDLEARVKELKTENADLHAHLLNVTQRTTEVQKQRISMERLMATKLAEADINSGNDQTELDQIVKQYTDIYADYGRCRQREVSFHLQQLEKLIIPTLTTKMSLWALQQDRSFYQRHKSPMFDILSKELEITPEQSEKIQERR